MLAMWYETMANVVLNCVGRDAIGIDPIAHD